MQTWALWVALPENRSALAAVERVADCVCGRQPRRAVNPLYLHGPAGVGKTHLVAGLAARVVERQPGLSVPLFRPGARW